MNQPCVALGSTIRTLKAIRGIGGSEFGFAVEDWVDSGDGDTYQIVTESFLPAPSGITAVSVQALVSGSVFQEVDADLFIDGLTGVITVKVPQSPDLRFIGRLVVP